MHKRRTWALSAYEGLYNEEDNYAVTRTDAGTFLELVQIYSPSGGEKEQCQWLMNYFKERGIEAFHR